MTDRNTSDKVNEAGTDELLAKLERLTENGISSRSHNSSEMTAFRKAAEYSEHQRLYEFVEQLTSPIRFALNSDEVPPVLPEYDELEEIGRGGMQGQRTLKSL